MTTLPEPKRKEHQRAALKARSSEGAAAGIGWGDNVTAGSARRHGGGREPAGFGPMATPRTLFHR